MDSTYSAASTAAPYEGDNRWSVKQEVIKVFNKALKSTFDKDRQEPESRVETCDKEEHGDYDYLCTSVMHLWMDIRETRKYKGPKHAALFLMEKLPELAPDMMENCVSWGPGFVLFNLSGRWMANSIYKMINDGIDTWAPKLPLKKAVIEFLPRNLGEEMHMGHLRSTIIGETLARMLEYSRVEVIRRRTHDEDHLNTKFKTFMEFLIERFPDGEVNIDGELEVLYKESKKRFDEDAGFRERARQQVWDERHHNLWVQICKLSRERCQKVYQRLGVHVEEESKRFNDFYISKTRDLLREKGLTTIEETEGDDEAIIFQEQKLPLVDLAALCYALDVVKADWIVHVSDVEQGSYLELCYTAAKHAGWIVTDHPYYPLTHVGFGLVECDLNFDASTKVDNLVNLLDKAKSCCKSLLLAKGEADQWTAEELEQTAEALGYGAVKYADLKNNRLTSYTFSFDHIFDEQENTAVYLQYTHARTCSVISKSGKDIKDLKVEELILNGDAERELGLHLLLFTEVLEDVCKVLLPHILCEYLYDLCKKFNRLYSSSSVSQVVGSGEETSKLLLCMATAMVMRKCFHLLGITPIYKI